MKKFLIVDDSIFMRNAIKKILIENGYIVVAEAEDGKTAVEKYIECSPDIVTLDVTMKEMCGLEALKKILEYDKNANVIMVSSMGQRPIVEEAIKTGAKGFLLKPFNEKQVISSISSLK